VARKLLWASLALAPTTVFLAYGAHADKVTLFVVAAIALVPLAWLIGESTEHAAEHTGPRVGGFLNASFGNAPELIIALFAIADNLPAVVRGSLAGSVISNLLLVFGITEIAGKTALLDRRSLLTQVSLVGVAVIAFLPTVVIGYQGDPDRHSAVLASIPASVILLVLYLAVTIANLRAQPQSAGEEPESGSWTLPVALTALGIATVATAVVSEILVHSLDAFAHAVGLSQFFIAAVIVAIVGNAAEHGGAVVIAHRGKMPLASEIAISSSAQVALLVTPLVMLVSLAFAHPLALTFRWVEIGAMAGAAVVVTLAVRDGESSRPEGFVLVAAYLGVVAVFLAAGDR
jgi:Ca2+:H+ antiporter